MLPDQSIGPIVAASIAAIITIIGIIATRYQKTSELRYEWMSDLQKDVAKFLSSTASLVERRRENNGKQLSFKVEEPYFSSTNEAAVKIRLCLRLMDESDVNIRKTLEDILSSFADIEFDTDSYNRRVEKLVESVAGVLKNEWGKIKQGPMTLRVLWWIAIAVLVSSLMAIAIHLSR